MLAELRIENLLLISSVHIELSQGLNAFTGETGAGKSLLVDALNLVLGARGDHTMVRQGAAQAEVAARFLIFDSELTESLAHDLGIVFDGSHGKGKSSGLELVVSRTLPRNGRARAHANGRPISLPALKELGDRLLDIHGQHENQSLLRPFTRIDILDRFAGALVERSDVRRLHSEALEAARALAALRRAAQHRHDREEMLRFQFTELKDAQLDDLDPEELEGEVRLLRSAEKIREAAVLAQSVLDGDDADNASMLIARALKSLNALGDAGPDVSKLRGRLDDLLSQTREISGEAGELADKARSDPQRLSALEDSRNRLRALERKYGRGLPDLKTLRDKLASDLADMEQIEVRTEQRETDLSRAIGALEKACESLTRKRKAAARDLEKRVGAELADLGLKGARLQVLLTPNSLAASDAPESQSSGADLDAPPEFDAEHDSRRLLPQQLKSTGAEGVEIVFTANPELPARPLKECASGGEISRVMLALKGVLARVSGADRLPVVVFDEVDSGVGGRLGAVLGKKLGQLAQVRQVLCVTHQPQIAAYAARQLKVDKTRSGETSLVRVECVEGPRRVDELAVMLRGEGASAHTRAEAAAMLKEAQAPAVRRR